MIASTILLTVLTSSATAVAMPAAGPGMLASILNQQPDTQKARPLERWPNDQDLAKLHLMEGKPRWVVLFVLGHPSGVQRHADGRETWFYPWVAVCCVFFKDGVCTGSFYTAGY
jgi:hypothetical protein